MRLKCLDIQWGSGLTFEEYTNWIRQYTSTRRLTIFKVSPRKELGRKSRWKTYSNFSIRVQRNSHQHQIPYRRRICQELESSTATSGGRSLFNATNRPVSKITQSLCKPSPPSLVTHHRWLNWLRVFSRVKRSGNQRTKTKNCWKGSVICTSWTNCRHLQGIATIRNTQPSLCLVNSQFNSLLALRMQAPPAIKLW